MTTLYIGDRRIIDGIEHQIEDLSITSARIENVQTGQSIKVSMEYLRAHMTPVPEARTPSSANVTPFDLESARKNNREFATLIDTFESTFNEFCHATSTVPRRDVITALCQRLRSRGINYAEDTVRKKFTHFCNGDYHLLVDHRSKRRRHPHPAPSLDPRVREAFDRAILFYARKEQSTRTKSLVINKARAELESVDANLWSDTQLRTYQRYVQWGAEHLNMLKTARSRRTRAASPSTLTKPHRPQIPGHGVEVDTNTVDVQIRCQDPATKKWFSTRPYLIAYIDPASGYMCAAQLFAKQPSSQDQTDVLLSTMVPQPLPKDSAALRALHAHPRFTDAIDTAYRTLTSNALFPISSLVTDNGNDYVSLQFTNACARLGIDISRAAVYSGAQKPHIERSFRTIGTTFLQGLGSYVGKGPEDRGVELPIEELPTLEELQDKLDVFRAFIWPFKEMQLPGQHTITTPFDRMNSYVQHTGTLPFFPSRDVVISLFQRDTRTLHRSSVRINNAKYTSSRLKAFVLEHVTIRTVDVHFNRSIPDRVWVKNPFSDEYIECARHRDIDNETVFQRERDFLDSTPSTVISTADLGFAGLLLASAPPRMDDPHSARPGTPLIQPTPISDLVNPQNDVHTESDNSTTKAPKFVWAFEGLQQ